MSETATIRPQLAKSEFIALMAMLSATIAFSIDAMLPALPVIGAELAPDDPNDAQFVILAFVMGMGVATMIAGPLSDSLGRKPVMIGGAVLYCVGAAMATVMPTLEGVIVARVIQGVGAAGPRVVAMALVRDLYAGRGMAKVVSFIMMVFALVPAIAPMMGAGIIALTGWRGVFWSFVVFSAISVVWLWVRQPETLAHEARRPMRLTPLLDAAREVVSISQVRRAVAAQTLVFCILFSTLVTVQPIYDVVFNSADTFVFWFGAVAVVSTGASVINAQLVERLGMLWLIRRALAGHLILTLLLLVTWFAAPAGTQFAMFVLFQIGCFSLAGLTIGNLNALAMQPLGHVAGMASSIVSSVATLGAVIIAGAVGQAFDGTPVPLAVSVAVIAAAALWLAQSLREEPRPDEGRGVGL